MKKILKRGISIALTFIMVLGFNIDALASDMQKRHSHEIRMSTANMNNQFLLMHGSDAVFLRNLAHIIGDELHKNTLGRTASEESGMFASWDRFDLNESFERDSYLTETSGALLNSLNDKEIYLEYFGGLSSEYEHIIQIEYIIQINTEKSSYEENSISSPEIIFYISDEQSLHNVINQAAIATHMSPFTSQQNMNALTLQLENDIELSGTLVIPSNADIILSGDYELRTSTTGTVIEVLPGANLVIDGITITSDWYEDELFIQIFNEYIQHDLYREYIDISERSIEPFIQNARVVVAAGAMATMISGEISGHRGPGNHGGGVEVNGRFIMDGGTIHNNNANNGIGIHAVGGGVAVSPLGTFTMNGGIIRENTANGRGGGVANSGLFIMNDGIIYSNQGGATGGGGVYNEGTFLMFGGEIRDNTATNGGGVFNDFRVNHNLGVPNGAFIEYGKFTMLGGIIRHNISTTSGGGVNNRGHFTMYYGKILGNHSPRGGGISIGTARVSGTNIPGSLNPVGAFTLNHGSITSNTANNGGGIYSSGKIVINNGVINNNMASVNGAGVFLRNNEFISTKILGGRIEANTASRRGGAIAIAYHGLHFNTVNSVYTNPINTAEYATLETSENAVFTNNRVPVSLHVPPTNARDLTNINWNRAYGTSGVGWLEHYDHLINNFDISFINPHSAPVDTSRPPTPPRPPAARITQQMMIDFGWQGRTDDAEINRINQLLEDFGITTWESIRLFMATVGHESEKGERPLERLNPDGTTGGGYTPYERGAGYIQLTWADTHRAFLAFIGSDFTGIYTAQYIADNWAWEASVWYWAMFRARTPVGFLNDFAAHYGDSIGVYFLIQCWVQGWPYGFDNNIIPGITYAVRDSTLSWEVVNDRLIVDGLDISSAPCNWHTPVTGRLATYNSAMEIFRGAN